MEHFAGALQDKGHHVLHLTLDDTSGHTNLTSLLDELIERFSARRFEYQ